MRFALLLALLPVIAAAQDVPSLQRPYATLPIADALPVLRTRLGGPGGAFAAAQIALHGREGYEILLSERKASDPLARLDVAYGLSFFDTENAYEALTELLGDPDPRVVGEASHGLRLAGMRAGHALQTAAFSGSEASGNAAVWLMFELGPPYSEALPGIAKSSTAAGRQTAIEISALHDFDTLASASIDPRPGVREAALRKLVFGPKTAERLSAIRKIATSKNASHRRSLVNVIAENVYNVDFLDQLLFFASDPSPDVRASVARTLPLQSGAIPGLTPERRLRLAKAIAQLTDDPISSVGNSMVDNLGIAAEQWLNGSLTGRPFETSADTVRRLRNALARRLSGPHAERAAFCLATLSDRRAFPVLAREVDAQPAGAVSAIVALGVLRDRRATPHLLLAASTGLDQYAYTALGRLRDPRSVPPLIGRMLAHPEREAYGAAVALAKIGDRRAAAPLMKLATRPNVDPNLRAAFYNPLGELGGPGVLDFLIDRLERGNALETVCAADGLVALHDPRALDIARQLASLPDEHRAKEAQRVVDALLNVHRVSS